MQLKSLEIKGFKSFVEKTHIHFDNAITGIVGPNGCGKSNVVDAIRWVLGEQKPTVLRLEKMEDVIFNGTKERSKANLAEVSLTLDNTRNVLPTEFTSVTVSRILTRDGESEYKLNGIPCRLKDIRNLFLDTGISNDTYAIIELKMIDEILNDVDKARRRLIEQSAGVSKFKTRKRETLLKLAGTDADLNRVDDLLFEIEKNLKALESQARKAKQFKKIREEYKDLSVELAKFDLVAIQSRYAVLQENIRLEEEKQLQAQAATQKKEAALQKEKLLILEKEKSLSEQQRGVNTLLDIIRNKESTRRLAEQKHQYLLERSQTLSAQIGQAVMNMTVLQKEITATSSETATYSLALTSQKTELEKAKSILEESREKLLAYRQEAESHRDGFQQHRNKVVELEKLIAVRESGIEQLEQTINRSLFENEERLLLLNTLQAELKVYEEKIKIQQSLLADLVVKEENNESTINQLEIAIREEEQELALMNRQLDAKNNEYKLTKNMIDNLEGFPESIKFLKKEAGWLKDAPLLSDIIDCDDEYRVVIEQLLQPWLNNYIVDKEDFAYNALELLSKSSAGKASFLVLEYFKQEGNISARKIEGLRAAIDVLDVEDKYFPLMSYLLDGIYIAPDQGAIAKALKSPKLKNTAFVIATPSGHLMRGNIQLSGGAVGLFEGKRVGRMKNLDKLQAEIKSLEEKAQHLKRKVLQDQQAFQQLRKNSYRGVIERERIALQQLEKDLISRQSRIDNYRDIVSQNDTQHINTRKTLEGMSEEIRILHAKLVALHAETGNAQEKMTNGEVIYQRSATAFSKEHEQYNQLHIAYIQQENFLQTQKQALLYKQDQLKDALALIKNNEQESKKAEEEMASLKLQETNLAAELEINYDERDKLMNTLSSNENDYYNHKEKLHKNEDLIREGQLEERQADHLIAQYKEQVNDLKLKLNVLKERFRIEFKLDIEELIENLILPASSREDLEDKLSRVRNRIDNFGDVNPMAEEAYDEMKERFDFINTQKKDLVEAKQDLLATIKEIEETAKIQFMETFISVRENFIKVFRGMFNPEDSCDLILDNPDDPLESDIDIIAKPKGKRPQSVNQLSGGEKSLTALSLLFALYLHKPAPFCILDEVDAPLDDTNIKKFNETIRQFSDNSQFILVTHNKQTMASVDVIYGVTMLQKGISRVVPVDFRHLN